MARLMRETVWRDLGPGDEFRVPGIRGRRFRFLAHVTNFDNGATHIEAVDTADGRFRAFRSDRRIVKQRRNPR